MPNLVRMLVVMERTLADAPRGASFVVSRVDLQLGHARRLAELGVRAGARVTIMGRTVGRGAVLDVAGGRIALDRTMLSGIHAAPDTVSAV